MHMEHIITGAAVLQGVAISLGVGGSTLAIINFFAAIADGVIDEKERYMMGFVYFVLRIAMVIILITLLVEIAGIYLTTSTLVFDTDTAAKVILVAVLYSNAVLMTLRKMPSTIGPALQASSWYTLGFMASLASLGLTTFTVLEFSLGYATVFLLAVAVVNGTMAIQKARRE